MKTRWFVTIMVLGFIFGAILYLQTKRPLRPTAPLLVTPLITTPSATTTPVLSGKSATGKIYPPAKELESLAGFINTGPLTIKELLGQKVILVDFWTYSCINCQRTTPYLNAWYERYAPQGLVIIGVHTPEFEFEKNYDNVKRAVLAAGIKYPVVLDNDYATWLAYGNRFWPHKYLIDIHGNIVYDHIGEGSYDETEQKIRALLAERAKVLGETAEMPAALAKPVDLIALDVAQVGSPEVYFGAARTEFLGNGLPYTKGLITFSGAVASSAKLNTLYLGGTWQIAPEYAETAGTENTVVFRYRAKNVYLVAAAGSSTVIEVWLDGKKINEVTIAAETLYPLIKGAVYGEHLLELRLPKADVRLYTFTFG